MSRERPCICFSGPLAIGVMFPKTVLRALSPRFRGRRRSRPMRRAEVNSFVRRGDTKRCRSSRWTRISWSLRKSMTSLAWISAGEYLLLRPSSTTDARGLLQTSFLAFRRWSQRLKIRCATAQVYVDLPPKHLTSRKTVEVGLSIFRAISEKDSCRPNPRAMLPRSSTPKQANRVQVGQNGF